MSGYEKDSSIDEYERKEQLRKNRRRPIQETLNELGEGRGMSDLRNILQLLINSFCRYIWSRLCRETAGEDKAELRD